MLWPIGQPLGEPRALAVKSLEIWLDVLRQAGLPHDCCGSLHLAYHEDEAQILYEYAERSSSAGEPVEVLAPVQVGQRTKAVKRDGLQAALWSARETCVDPRAVIAALPGWLERQHGVSFHFGKAITEIDLPRVRAGAAWWQAERAWICTGVDFETLFPEEFAACGMLRCKLQMMRSQPLTDWRLGPMLAAGLTLRHYRSFEACPTWPVFKERIARESPWFDEYGIHVLVSQNPTGELTLGDSHEYGDGHDPFDKSEIDELILSYLGTFLDAPVLKIASRWHGLYSKHPHEAASVFHPRSLVTAITGVGGAGMTMSFGLADRVVSQGLGEAED
jgi:FAD dependent oxidoreductase TIGR03364